MYTGISAIALVVFYIILPETKGKTIEQMNLIWLDGSLFMTRVDISHQNVCKNQITLKKSAEKLVT